MCDRQVEFPPVAIFVENKTIFVVEVRGIICFGFIVAIFP